MMPLGQRIILGIRGTELTSGEINLIEKFNIGGFILFDRNADSLSSLRVLIDRLYEICTSKPFICIDYEGGKVRRLGNLLPPLREPRFYVNSNNLLESDINSAAAVFRDIGINVNFAPVADLDYVRVNPALKNRTYSDDPLYVSQFCIEFMRNFNSCNIACCAKHFPGLGAAVNDPHEAVSINCQEFDHLLKFDLIPFKACIAQNVRFMMSSHVRITSIDDEICTFSPRYPQMARDLGFEGILITDDLTMEAINPSENLEESVLKALCSGHDIALICHHHQKHQSILQYLENNLDKLIETGHENSLERIVNIKESVYDR